MAIEPTAVTIHESSEMAPTRAMFAGSMMMPDPIMFTATRNVSWVRVIFFLCIAPPGLPRRRARSLAHHVGEELDAAVRLLLEHTLDFVVEPREPVERLLECQELVEHRR